MTIERLPDIKTKIIEPSANADDVTWETINQEIESLKKLSDQNAVAKQLLDFTDDENPQVRDAVASSFAVLDITDANIFEKVANKMIFQATNPYEQIYACGRAATFLLNNQLKSEKFVPALQTFKDNHQSADIKMDLIDNIPQLQILFNS